jgi:hypothetical protein
MRKDRKEKTKDSLEKFLVVESVTVTEESAELLNYANTKVDGNVTVETESSAVKVSAVLLQIKRRHDPYGSDFLLDKTIEILVESRAVQV